MLSLNFSVCQQLRKVLDNRQKPCRWEHGYSLVPLYMLGACIYILGAHGLLVFPSRGMHQLGERHCLSQHLLPWGLWWLTWEPESRECAAMRPQMGDLRAWIKRVCCHVASGGSPGSPEGLKLVRLTLVLQRSGWRGCLSKIWVGITGIACHLKVGRKLPAVPGHFVPPLGQPANSLP